MGCGASKGVFFKVSDPPHDVTMRDKVLLAIMGSPDGRPKSPRSTRATSTAPCRISRPTLSNCWRPSRR
nr:PrpF domain-containing protein [Rhodoblastus sp.]